MEYRTLPVMLTEDEVKQKGDVLATRIEERAKLDGERKAASERFKEELKEIDGDIGSLARQLRERKEHRVINCMWERDDARFSMVLIRQDTGEIVDTRPMRDDERQGSLFAEETPPTETQG
jgi:hypothetical protein